MHNYTNTYNTKLTIPFFLMSVIKIYRGNANDYG